MMSHDPANWGGSSSTVGDGHRGDIDSGTSVVHVEGQKWLVAFQHYDQAKVFEFDSSVDAPHFGAEVTPVPGVVNNNLIDRPAMVNRNGRLIVSWLMSDKLQMVTGDIQVGQPVWQSGYLFDDNVTEQGFGPAVGAQDLAHDGQDFYAAVVRRRDPQPGEEVIHYYVFIHTSNNGLNWTRLTHNEIFKIPHSMGIAARGPNDIIVLSTFRYSAIAGTQVFRFNGSNWTLLDDNAVFGSNLNNAGHDLTLYAKD